MPALFCLVAGGGDLTTGLLLLARPATVLRLLGLARPAADLALLRFVGVFVASVGLAYLYPWLLRDAARRDRRLAAALEMTAGVRLAVALFIGVTVVAGEMEMPWLTVGAYDALLASAQLVLLWRGAFGEGRLGDAG